ncbi:M16 family metallopeptidase [Pseudosporangium ferrugineum]|uniref:Putative Zn-dependent peptidase n=1 Tax=Pseudosporangium ferrugineum TaxID=439699 RepID=A0A2T0SDS1_9ACTN|nr:pitrilysin family protein [Pseudosporangium ferrugineum]PRY31559.1 putative Zn-dependent peptidase [Pseudosporangium ferrugineum]
MTIRTLPDLVPDSKIKLPKQAERTLSSGLTVIAIRRPAVPLVELRLRVPFGRAPLARATVLSQSLFTGTATMSSIDIAAELQAVGGGLSAGLDPDRLLITGNSLAAGLDRMLEILAGVLTDAAYPADEVATERDRLVDHIQVAQSQPAHLARTALLKRMYGRHPYAVQTPEPEQVKGVRPAQLRALHADRVRPDGSVLVLVGDLNVEKAIDAAEKALGGWIGPGRDGKVPPTPALEPGPLVLVDRPGAVQSSLRMALPAVPRTDPDHAPLQLANMVFGGYFSSRWVENIREDKGYTYGPHTAIEHFVAGSALVVSAEVATEVTGPAMLETLYELGRIASLPPGEDELEQARRYALGTLRLGMSTQAGLAGLASIYASFGLRLDYLTEYSAALSSVTREQVADVAARYLAPSRAVSVVLGDAEKVEAQLAALTAVERGAE